MYTTAELTDRFLALEAEHLDSLDPLAEREYPRKPKQLWQDASKGFSMLSDAEFDKYFDR